MDNRRDGVEKRELLLARQAGNRGGEVGRRKWTCRYNHAVPLAERDDFSTLERHQWM
jgi:hypothetical protein